MARELKLTERKGFGVKRLRRDAPASAQDSVYGRPSPSAAAELKPYGPQIKVGKFTRYLLVISALFFCFLYGLSFSFFAPYIVLPFAAPLIVLAGLVLWALPEVHVAPARQLENLFFLYFFMYALWPKYLAIALPGLPWITVQRLLGFLLILTLMISLSISAPFRSRLYAVLNAAPLLSKCIALFLLIQALSIVFSADKAFSINLFLNVFTGWISPFVVGAFVLSRRGRLERFGALLCCTALALAGIAFWERHLGRVPWAGHIPKFLQINDPSVQMTLLGLSRSGLDHRVQTTFSTSLAFSEYLAMSMPFLLNFAFGRYPLPTRAAAIVAIPILLSALVMTQARTGMIGAIVAVTTYPVIRVFLYWRRNRQNLAASTALVLSPVAVAAFLAISYIVPALHNRMFGGGRDISSNDSRRIQIDMGIPLIVSRPWGYGLGEGADTLQYPYPGAGSYSIDVYQIRLLLEYGIVGFFIYYAMVGSAIYYALKYTLQSADLDRDKSFFIPLLIAGVGFTLMQIYFALEDNQPIMYVFYGALLAMIYRCSNLSKTQAGTSRAV